MSNSEDKSSMADLVQPSEHFCYVKCNFCNTVLAVGIPCRHWLDTVTVKCGHCSNLSFLSTRPPLQGQCIDHPLTFQSQVGFSNNDHIRKGASTSSTSTASSITNDSPNFVVKPPEKKHRLPSAYNRFMKEEIQRIKAANPEIPHREAFSAAAKNWARYIPNSAAGSVSGTHNNNGLFQFCRNERVIIRTVEDGGESYGCLI
ncbi:protein CRABS CLAW isoform X1 [Cucumis sativus]|uniref:protein CRABS CLAW isoform X1 n=1 Tax=Cucumis sativus TaxID=3659 RepID=UPI0012F4C4FD|nr:protein CRABS CLAW isoform X1 [Cucumis sativus]